MLTRSDASRLLSRLGLRRYGRVPARLYQRRTCVRCCVALTTGRSGGVSRVAKGADCKSAALWLRRFESYLPHHEFVRLRRFPDGWRNPPTWRRFLRPLGLCKEVKWNSGLFRYLRLCPRNPVSRQRRPWRGEIRFECRSYCAGSPSTWCCRDHPGGRSQRRATPIPCRSRPSTAALTRSGAKNASEIVMLTLRALQPSRSAMRSTVVVGSAINSSSQRRPRAIDATSVARVSARMGRARSDGIDAGRRISRRRTDGVLSQGTRRVRLHSARCRFNLPTWARWTTNCLVRPRRAQRAC